MFTNISWGNYIIVVALSVASWYLLIGSRFYFDELKDLMTGKRKKLFRESGANYDEQSTSISNSQDENQIAFEESTYEEFDTTFRDVDALVKQLKIVIEDASKSKFPKQEMIDNLKLILATYPLIKNSSFSYSVSE